MTKRIVLFFLLIGLSACGNSSEQTSSLESDSGSSTLIKSSVREEASTEKEAGPLPIDEQRVNENSDVSDYVPSLEWQARENRLKILQDRLKKLYEQDERLKNGEMRETRSTGMSMEMELLATLTPTLNELFEHHGISPDKIVHILIQITNADDKQKYESLLGVTLPDIDFSKQYLYLTIGNEMPNYWRYSEHIIKNKDEVITEHTFSPSLSMWWEKANHSNLLFCYSSDANRLNGRKELGEIIGIEEEFEIEKLL